MPFNKLQAPYNVTTHGTKVGSSVVGLNEGSVVGVNVGKSVGSDVGTS